MKTTDYLSSFKLFLEYYQDILKCKLLKIDELPELTWTLKINLKINPIRYVKNIQLHQYCRTALKALLLRSCIFKVKENDF